MTHPITMLDYNNYIHIAITLLFKESEEEDNVHTFTISYTTDTREAHIHVTFGTPTQSRIYIFRRTDTDQSNTQEFERMIREIQQAHP